jgi:hypothetical protein
MKLDKVRSSFEFIISRGHIVPPNIALATSTIGTMDPNCS